MNVNYNSLGSNREVTVQKNRKIGGSAPRSTVTRTSWWLTCCLMVMLSFGNVSFAGAPPVKNATAILTTCGNQTVLAASSLPISNQALVCGTTNDITSANSTVCGSDLYKGGQESLYSLTPTQSGVYNISYSGVSWVGIFVYAGCPTSGGTCVNNVTGSGSAKNMDVNLTAGTEYFIMFDTYPAPNSPCPGTFSITLPPLCAKPTAVAASTSSNSANISFAESGSNYIVEYGAVGFTPGTGATAGTGGTIVTGGSPVSLSGLMASTAYNVYVRQICAGGGYSPNSTMVAFTTGCAVITTFPAIEDFSTFPPQCWKRLSGGDLVSGPSTTTSTKWGNDGFLNVGTSGSARVNIFNVNSNHWLISPDYVLPAGAQVKYDVGATNYNASTAVTNWEADDFVELLVSVGGTNWTVLETYNANNVPSNTGQIAMSSLSSYVGQTVRFAFRVVEGADNGPADFDFFIDNFRVGAAAGAPICATNLMPADASVNVVKNPTLTWTSAADATSYDVYFGTNASPAFAINVVGTSYSPGLLATGTTYYWSVTPKNAAGSASSCAVQSFTTGSSLQYCASVPTSKDGSGITNVQLATTDFPIGTGTYFDQSATAIAVVEGANTNLQVTFATGYSYHTNVWIDFNDNGVFDASELVFQGESTNANPTTFDASFVIPEGSPVGVHRMRIGTADSGQSTPNPCYSSSYGVTVDLSVNITANTVCEGTPAPGATVASAASVCSGSSVTLTLENSIVGSGITYVWESADDANFTQNLQTLASTGASATVIVESNKFYRAMVSCGNNTGTSTAIAVTLNAVVDCYCESTPNSVDGLGITNVQVGATDFPIDAVTYTDLTASPVALSAGEMANVQITFETGYTYNTYIFVDFNNDGDFSDDGELVFTGESTNAEPTTLDASFMIDAAAAQGSHRMRIITADFLEEADPCASPFYGATVELTITIGDDCIPTNWYADTDNDGYGNPDMMVSACDAPVGYVADATDCDDTNGSIYRNGNFYVDNDGDGYGASASTESVCYGATTPAGYSVTSLGIDCDDANAAVFQSGTLFVDADLDGYTAGSEIVCYGATVPSGYLMESNGADCNDDDATVYQSAMLFVDIDGDGYTVGEATSICYGAAIPVGYVATSMGVDCDDTDATLFQSILVFEDMDGDGYTVGDAIAICFGTAIPEGYTETSLGEDCNDDDATVWQSELLFVDMDEDGYTSGQATNVCYGATIPAGYSETSLGADCNDNDATVWQSMLLFVDMDGDGYTVGEALSVCYGASLPTGYSATSLGMDCNDDDASAWQSATVYIDMDGDGFHGQMIEDYCYGATLPANYSTTTLGVDCDDNNAAINPNATEIPGNGIDENCDGTDGIGNDIPVTTLRTQYCGAVGVTPSEQVRTYYGLNQSGYRFNIYDESGSILLASIDNTPAYFRFAQFDFAYGATYQVKVQVKQGNLYGAEGAACSVTVMDLPTVTLRSSYCGATNILPYEKVYANYAINASAYKFNIYDAAGSTLIATIVNSNAAFRFTQMAYTNGATYQVKVQVLQGEEYGAEGASCSVTLSSGAMTTRQDGGLANNSDMGAMDFKAEAYPNPFAENFKLNVISESDASIQVRVYDMIGKLLEDKMVSPSDIQTLEVGSRYPAGVYNVIVTQDSTVKTIRVIKR